MAQLFVHIVIDIEENLLKPYQGNGGLSIFCRLSVDHLLSPIAYFFSSLFLSFCHCLLLSIRPLKAHFLL